MAERIIGVSPPSSFSFEGEKGRRIYDTYEFENTADKVKLKPVLKKFEEYCNSRRNTTFERHTFFTYRQQEGLQTFTSFVTELKKRSTAWGFDALTHSLIKDMIICGASDNSFRERMLRGPNIWLQKAKLDLGAVIKKVDQVDDPEDSASFKSSSESDFLLESVVVREPNRPSERLTKESLQKVQFSPTNQSDINQAVGVQRLLYPRSRKVHCPYSVQRTKASYPAYRSRIRDHTYLWFGYLGATQPSQASVPKVTDSNGEESILIALERLLHKRPHNNLTLKDDVHPVVVPLEGHRLLSNID
ncbi:Hypothetical predicted protein [Paramuricea clavata]|uniref:Uncharacterized protein n=1 Tax=Paramuricea clavata TaxID=317549 RepID=A0A7D9HNA5_PARCT|nr:Hypothetical predicted protein [Paramuricea clavata]